MAASLLGILALAVLADLAEFVRARREALLAAEAASLAGAHQRDWQAYIEAGEVRLDGPAAFDEAQATCQRLGVACEVYVLPTGEGSVLLPNGSLYEPGEPSVLVVAHRPVGLLFSRLLGLRDVEAVRWAGAGVVLSLIHI